MKLFCNVDLVCFDGVMCSWDLTSGFTGVFGKLICKLLIGGRLALMVSFREDNDNRKDRSRSPSGMTSKKGKSKDKDKSQDKYRDSSPSASLRVRMTT